MASLSSGGTSPATDQAGQRQARSLQAPDRQGLGQGCGFEPLEGDPLDLAARRGGGGVPGEDLEARAGPRLNLALPVCTKARASRAPLGGPLRRI